MSRLVLASASTRRQMPAAGRRRGFRRVRRPTSMKPALMAGSDRQGQRCRRGLPQTLAEQKAHDGVPAQSRRRSCWAGIPSWRLGPEIIGKSHDLAALRALLLRLSGKTPCSWSPPRPWRGTARSSGTIPAAPGMTMRALSEAFLDDYLAREGEKLLVRWAAIIIEGPGAQLFEQVEGDYFTILGLPLLPVLAALRAQGIAGVMMLTGAGKIAGVMGWPIAHSLSPLLHGYWLNE